MSYLNYNNAICVTAAALLSVVPKGTYDSHKNRGNITVVRRACLNTPALVSYDSLPAPIKQKVVEKFGPPEVTATVNGFIGLVGMDDVAIQVYSHYLLADGRYLPADAQREYITNANLLGAIHKEYTAMVAARSKHGKKWNGYWPKRAAALQQLKLTNPDLAVHTLPKNPTALRRKYVEFATPVKGADGKERFNYESLISGKYCNTNTLKVDAATEQLLLSIYTGDKRPFAVDVYTEYTLFIKGKRNIVNVETGELYNRADFKELSEATVRNWLKNGLNDAIADSKRMGMHNFNNEQRPFVRRKAPLYSLSKLSMDDRDLPRKLASGKRVKAYYAYDVASGAVVGYAHSQSKDEALFIDCLRSTFNNIYSRNMVMPAEVEVENHLVSKFFNELGLMFPFLTICAPGNSQQKRAEHFNRTKKYGAEKQLNPNGIGRWWAKGKAYRIDQDFVNGEFVGQAFGFDQLVREDIEAINLYNNSLHPKQDVYPGLTRLQVLEQCQNPNLPMPNRALIAQCVGNHTTTTIRRNKEVQVQGCFYNLPNLTVLNLLTPGNFKVDAYWLPLPNGDIDAVYLYQNGRYVATAERIVAPNEAKVERTAADTKALHRQLGYAQGFDAAIKQGQQALQKVAVIDTEAQTNATNAQLAEAMPTKVVSQPVEEPAMVANIEFDMEFIKNQAKKGL